MGTYIGELAALAASFLFAATSTFFTLAGRRVGSLVVNRTRLVIAVLLLVLLHLVLGIPLPFQAGGERWLWLSLSGFAGLALGDAFLFQAFVWIGPRLSMLLMSLAPVIAAMMGWLFLRESLTPSQILGMALTLGGVAWVVLDRNGRLREFQTAEAIPKNERYLIGILFGLLGATGQALGLVLAKPGLAGDFPPISATFVRMLAALVVLWTYTLLRGQGAETLHRLRQSSRAIWFILLGAISGPTVAVSLNMFSIQKTAVGITSTLNSLTPVILLPVGYLLFKERFGWGAVAGTLLAIGGVALLLLG
jgi:drug/metabolite transporter (DMT)-like permease